MAKCLDIACNGSAENGTLWMVSPSVITLIVALDSWKTLIPIVSSPPFSLTDMTPFGDTSLRPPIPSTGNQISFQVSVTYGSNPACVMGFT